MKNGSLNALFAFVLIILVSAMWLLPKLAVPRRISLHNVEKSIAIENRARQTLVQVVGGLFFLVTAYTAWRSLKVNEENARTTQANLRVAQDNLRLLEENSERTRELELYKFAFPEIFKAAQRLTNDAYNLERSVWHYQRYDMHRGTAEESLAKVADDADALIHYAFSIEWLVGSEVAQGARTFGISAKETVGWQDPEQYPIVDLHYTEAYQQFIVAVRKAAHVPTMEQIFPS